MEIELIQLKIICEELRTQRRWFEMPCHCVVVSPLSLTVGG